MRTWRPTTAETAVLLACIVLGGALSVCVVFGPAWLAGPEPGLTAADRLSAENDVRSTLLQGLGGLLALGGVAFGCGRDIASGGGQQGAAQHRPVHQGD